jgi:hypothetical protein
MAISGIGAGAGIGYQGLSQLQGVQSSQSLGTGQSQSAAQSAGQTGGGANPQPFQIQGPSKPSTGTGESQGSSQPVSTGPARPGQAGGGIGDLQAVAPSSVARGQIINISA